MARFLLIALSIVHADRHRGAGGHLLVVRHVLVLRVRPELPVVVAPIAAVPLPVLPVDVVRHHPRGRELGRGHRSSGGRRVLEAEGRGGGGQVASLGSRDHREVRVHDAPSEHSRWFHPRVGQRVDRVGGWRGEVLRGRERGRARDPQVFRVGAVVVHLPVLLPVEAEVVRREGGREWELVVRVDAQVVVQLGKVASSRCCRGGSGCQLAGTHLRAKDLRTPQ